MLLLLVLLCVVAVVRSDELFAAEGRLVSDALAEKSKAQHLPNEFYDDLEWTGVNTLNTAIYACRQYVCACVYSGTNVPCSGPNDYCFSCPFVSGVSQDVDSADVIHCALRCGQCKFNESGFPRGCCVDTGSWAPEVYDPLTCQYNWFVENGQWHHYSGVYLDLPDQFAPYRMDGVVLQGNTTFDCDCGCAT